MKKYIQKFTHRILGPRSRFRGQNAVKRHVKKEEEEVVPFFKKNRENTKKNYLRKCKKKFEKMQKKSKSHEKYPQR